jgi:hypothetical protein
MSKPFEWRDFTKKYNDLSSNNFPTLSKAKQVQDTLKFKFSSKAQEGVKFDSSVTNLDATTSEADFSAKVNVSEVKGLELGFKAKSKPSTEFTIKFDDKIVPLEGASVTVKAVATAPSEQTIGASFGYSNKIVNLNLGFSYPITQRLIDFIDGEKTEDLAQQKPKVDLDFVVKPLDGSDAYLGGNASVTLPKETDELLYSGKLALALNNNTLNGGAFVEHKKELKKKDDEKTYSNETTFGAWAYTEVDDLSGGAQVTYAPKDAKSTYKGFSFEAIAGLQRDADSKLSSKVQVIPDTTVSLGYEQKVSKSAKLTFGYSFLLNKTSNETKTKASAYHFGL